MTLTDRCHLKQAVDASHGEEADAIAGLMRGQAPAVVMADRIPARHRESVLAASGSSLEGSRSLRPQAVRATPCLGMPGAGRLGGRKGTGILRLPGT